MGESHPVVEYAIENSCLDIMFADMNEHKEDNARETGFSESSRYSQKDFPK